MQQPVVLNTIQKKKELIIIVIVCAAIATIGLLSNLQPYSSLLSLEEQNMIWFDRILLFFTRSFSNNRLLGCILFLFEALLLYLILADTRKSITAIKYAILFSLLIGAVQTVCIALAQTDDWYVVFDGKLTIIRALFKAFGISLTVFVFTYILLTITLYSSGKIISVSNKNRILKNSLLFFICWLPYLLVFFPGVSNWDVASEIAQFFHIKQDFILSLSGVEESGIYITNMHPFFDTVVFGSFIKIGTILFGSAAIGQAIYSIVQMILMSVLYSNLIVFIEKITRKDMRILVIFIAVCPLFAMYSISMLKDTLFSISFLAYICMLAYAACLVNNVWEKASFCFTFVIIVLLVALTKNQGIFIVILTIPITIVIFKSYWKRILICFILAIILKTLIWNNLVLSSFNVAPGGKQEAIGFMFQQSALYVKCYPDEITEEEKKAIENVLPYDELGELYTSNCHDSVKYEYNQKATDQMLNAYYRVWIKMFFKHPDCYIKALARSSYGYFYMNQDNNFIYTKTDNAVDEDSEIYIKNCFVTESGRQTIYRIINLIQRIPIVNIIFSISFYTWFCIFILLLALFKKQYQLLPVMAPAIVSILVFIVSPDNANMRYVMPLIISSPLFYGIVIYLWGFTNKSSEPVFLISVLSDYKK